MKKLILFFFISLMFALVLEPVHSIIGGGYCSLNGCTMQGDIYMGGYNIYNVTLVNVNQTNASERCFGDSCIDDWGDVNATKQEMIDTINTSTYYQIIIDWANIINRFVTAVDNVYIYMDGTTATLNETKLNETMDLRDDDTTYTNSSFDLSEIINTGDINMSGHQLLNVENITSPYANKSFIYFMSDGSIGIVLDPIEEPESPPLKEEEITRTPSTETTCFDGKCHLVLYSGVRFVEEDNQWKELWEVKSLKNSGIKCIVTSDGTHLAECEDFNYTHRRIKTSINELSAIDKTNIPITVYYEEYNLETERIDIIEKSKEYYNFELTPNRNEWIKASYGDIIKVGDKSTTIKLQEADTENLDDVYIQEDEPDTTHYQTAQMSIVDAPDYPGNNRNILIKFDISAIPSGQQIDEAKLFLYLFNNRLLSNSHSFNGSVNHIYNYPDYNISDFEWNETVATWNNRPNTSNQYNTSFEDTFKFFGGAGEPLGWIDWNTTNMVSATYDNNYANVPIYIIAHDGFGGLFASNTVDFRTKEYSTTSLRPYLNITYSLLPVVGVTSTLVVPADDSIDLDGVVTFNCSATATLSVLKNISLYHNITGTWKINETKTVTGTSDWANFTYDIANNTNLIWNCLASNNATTTSFADANWTLTVLFPQPKNPQLYVTNTSGDKQWYVDFMGDFWLRNAFKMNIIPKITETHSIGSSILRWLKGWFYDLDVSNDLNVGGNADVTGNLTYKTIYAQLSDLEDQGFATADTKQPINLTTTDEIFGIGVSESNITIQLSGVYDIAAQPQVTAGPGDAGNFHMWMEKYTGGEWLNVSNSNVELTLASNDEDVIPLLVTIRLEVGEKIRVMGSVSDTGIFLDDKEPAGEPEIPSIICRIFKLGD